MSELSDFPYECRKCGQKFYSVSSMNAHSEVCDGMTGVNMDMISAAARKAASQPDPVAFKCEICGGSQEIKGIHNWGKEIVFPVCNGCKNDLKEIILEKREHERHD